ncbi:hypothetical protein VUR80DRAFT_2219 [Thermomyces stellatus]
MEPSFRLFTSLRYDPALTAAHNNPVLAHAGWNFRNPSPCYMLDLHRDRMLRAARHWGWDKAVRVLSGDEGLQTLGRLAEEELKGDGPARVRVFVNEKGELRLDRAPERERNLGELFPARLAPPGEEEGEGPTWEVVLDDAGTDKSEFTHYKTTKREMYNLARERKGIQLGQLKEVLITGPDGVVMEGSITTPYFWREGRWVTPRVGATIGDEGCGGQDGTTRRWALESGLAVEGVVEARQLVDGELVWLSNGAKGFIKGRFQA